VVTSELVSGGGGGCGEGQAGAGGRGRTVQELVYAVARVGPHQREPTKRSDHMYMMIKGTVTGEIVSSFS